MTSPSPSELAAQLKKIGFRVLPDQLEDFLRRAKKGRWSTRAALAEMARLEEIERARRSLERRLRYARVGRFKPLADFDWNWPKKIDRHLLERALTLDFIPEGRNLILLGANGLGKTMITKNIAHAAVLAGHSVLFRTASELLDDLQLDSSELLRRRSPSSNYSSKSTRGQLELALHRRSWVSLLRLPCRRPALRGHQSTLRAPLYHRHHQPRVQELERRVSQRHLYRQSPRSSHPPRRYHRH